MRHFIVFAAVLAAACGVNESVVEQNDAADQLEADAELSATSRTYVAIRRDFRKCIYPMCGGYWVRDLNRVHLNEVYVSGLDFSQSGLTDDAKGQIEQGLEEVVLRGKLGPKEAQFGTRTFIVSEGYRGMPGRPVAATDKFFKVKEVDIQCIRAPCPSLAAVRVNYTAQTLFHDLSLTRATANRVDAKWLDKRATVDGAIVAGAWKRVGEELLLDAANVFLRLPENAGPCPVFKLANCPSGQVRTYKRSADRCILPSACVTPGACALFLPICDEGYTLQSWTSAPFACQAYVCDPTWVVGEQQ